jgi:hypothetical protein
MVRNFQSFFSRIGHFSFNKFLAQYFGLVHSEFGASLCLLLQRCEKMIRRPGGNAAAANRVQRLNGRAARNEPKFKAYVVMVGRRPGVYRQW